MAGGSRPERQGRSRLGAHARRPPRPPLEAASDARVELLLVQDGVDHPAWECPKCGRLAAESGSCPLDDTPMEETRNGVDLAMHQTLAHGGKVRSLRDRHDLEPVEGIGALLRY